MNWFPQDPTIGPILQMTCGENSFRSNKSLEPAAGRCITSLFMTKHARCKQRSLSRAVAHLVLVRSMQKDSHDIVLTAAEVDAVLWKLCADLGFCLPHKECQRFRTSPPSDVREFTN